jgi:hypothetical protein
MKTITSGNPYTHEEHERTSYNVAKGETAKKTCSWCGQEQQTLYQYDRTKGVFCSKSCWRSYHS